MIPTRIQLNQIPNTLRLAKERLKSSTRNANADTLDLIHQTVLDIRADFIKRKQTFISPNLNLVVPSSIANSSSENNRENNRDSKDNKNNSRDRDRERQRDGDRNNRDRDRNGRNNNNNNKQEEDNSNKRKISSVFEIDEGSNNKRQKTSENGKEQYLPENPTANNNNNNDSNIDSTKPKPKNLSEAIKEKLVCKECQLEFPNLHYFFYRDGVEANFSVDALSLHETSEHDANPSSELKNWLNSSRDSLKVDRSQDCPFLVRIFYQIGKSSVKETDFIGASVEKMQGTELHIHCWKDTSLRELVDLIREQVEDARDFGLLFGFWSVFSDLRGNTKAKELGFVDTSKESAEAWQDLNQLRYQVGDVISVNIFSSRRNRE